MDTLALLAQQDGGDVAGGLLSLACVIWLLSVIVFVFWLWMLIDALLNEPTTNEKILWFLARDATGATVKHRGAIALYR
jgi:hypothetical protein